MVDLLDKLKKMQTWKKSKKFYAEQLGITVEEVTELLKELNELEKEEDAPIAFAEDEIEKKIIEDKYKGEEGVLETKSVWKDKPASPEEIEDVHKIDKTKWKLDTYYSKWNGKEWHVTAIFKNKGNKVDFATQKHILLRELKAEYFTSERAPIKKELHKNKLLEISIFDPHFGKLAWGEETGDDYDIDIAETRYKTAIQELLSNVNLDCVERIHLPLGNDLFNMDSIGNTTTAGTPQDSDSRFAKMVQRVKRLAIETINMLAEIAYVDVTIVPGNHDLHTTFMLGEILEAYYHKDGRVLINNSPKTRKFYKFGTTSFMYTHGNDEKHADLGIIFATENPTLWAETQHRFVKVGHFHKNKRVEYISVDDHRGVQVQILPSLSGTDYWHYKKGYLSNKQAKAFLYDPKKGEIACYTYTV